MKRADFYHVSMLFYHFAAVEIKCKGVAEVTTLGGPISLVEARSLRLLVLGGSGGMLPRENFVKKRAKWCNLVDSGRFSDS